MSEFSGVSLFDFVEFKNFYKIDIVVYKLENNKAKVIQCCRKLYYETMKVNVFKNHLSLIVDFEKYCHVYQCMHCNKLWYQNCHYYRHTKTCLTTVCESFPGGVYHNYHNPYTIENLKKLEYRFPNKIVFTRIMHVTTLKSTCIMINCLKTHRSCCLKLVMFR